MITNPLTFLQPTSSYRELILLEEIGRNEAITQHELSAKAGVVPAMVNNYIKHFVKDRLISVAGNRTRNMRYTLTPEGERRKFQLLLSYVQETVRLYKNAKEGLKARLLEIQSENIHRIILYGAADTAELAYNAAEEIGIEICGIVDSDENKQGKVFLGKVIQSPSAIEDIMPDAVVISSFGFQDQIYEKIKKLEINGIKVRKL